MKDYRISSALPWTNDANKKNAIEHNRQELNILFCELYQNVTDK